RLGPAAMLHDAGCAEENVRRGRVVIVVRVLVARLQEEIDRRLVRRGPVVLALEPTRVGEHGDDLPEQLGEVREDGIEQDAGLRHGVTSARKARMMSRSSSRSSESSKLSPLK